MEKDRDHAGVIAFPPLLFGIPLAAGLVADFLISKKRLPPAAQFLSIGFFAAAASLVAQAFSEFKKAGTPVDPFEASTALVDTGVFEHVRNPIYLGVTLAYVGVALAARSRLPLAILPGVLWVINAGVIDREERYLEDKFGKAYHKYMHRAPRWF